MQISSAGRGLRERKKQRTREAISDVATRLFIGRGFDRVTVADVAQAADVSVNTVFNYFSTKEDLFFDRAEAFVDEPSRIVRTRRRGESAVDALYRTARAALRSESAIFRAQQVRPFIATIEKSPTLRLRFRTLMDETEERLAATLAADMRVAPDDPRPRVVAAFLVSIEWVLIQQFRARLLAREPSTKIRAALLRSLADAYALLRLALGETGK